MSAHSRAKADGGDRSDMSPTERISDVLRELGSEGEISTVRAEELLQLGVLEFTKIVLATSDLTREDVSNTLHMMADGVAPNASADSDERD